MSTPQDAFRYWVGDVRGDVYQPYESMGEALDNALEDGREVFEVLLARKERLCPAEAFEAVRFLEEAEERFEHLSNEDGDPLFDVTPAQLAALEHRVKNAIRAWTAEQGGFYSWCLRQEGGGQLRWTFTREEAKALHTALSECRKEHDGMFLRVTRSGGNFDIHHGSFHTVFRGHVVLDSKRIKREWSARGGVSGGVTWHRSARRNKAGWPEGARPHPDDLILTPRGAVMLCSTLLPEGSK